MKTLANWTACLAMVAAGMLAGCSQTVKPPDVAGNIRSALDQAGLKKVSVDQDRDKGVVTLGGHVASGRRQGTGGNPGKVARRRRSGSGPDCGAPGGRRKRCPNHEFGSG